MAAEQGEASAQVQPRGHVRQRVGRPRGFLAGANGHEGARESRDTLERDMTRAEISRAAPDGACPFAQCSKITTTCAPVNRFCRCFLWLPRIGDGFVTHCNAIVTGL